MPVLPVSRESLFAFRVFLFLFLSFCHAENETVEVVGTMECTDCTKNNIDISHTFAGLRVLISCKSTTNEISKTRGITKLDKRGNFKVSLPASEIVNNGKANEYCEAKVYNALLPLCLTQNRLEASKIIFNHDGLQFSGLTKKKLRFSTIRCEKKLSGRTFSQEAHIVFIPRPPPLPTYLNQPFPPAAPIPSPTLPQPGPSLLPYEPPMPISEPTPPPEAITTHPPPPPIPAEALTPPLPSEGSFNGPSPPPVPTEIFSPPPTSEPLPSQGSIFNGPISSPPIPVEVLQPPTSEPSSPQGPSEPSEPPFPLL